MELLSGVAAQDVTLFSGAGLSVEGPSSLPTGWELTRRVFGAYFAPGALDTVLAHHEAVGWLSGSPCPIDAPSTEPRPPRLETVLGVIARTYGDTAVVESLADIGRAAPNRLHHFAAQHLGAGGGQLTANFDECVELAARERGLRIGENQLLHFHGSTGHADRLGATLERIERGFPDNIAGRFLDMLTRRPYLLVLGYSGSDFFDVDVAIATLPPGHLTGTDVVWAVHSEHVQHKLDRDDRHRLPPLVAALRRAGARVDVVCGPTEQLVRRLGRQWAFDELAAAAGRDPRPPVITVPEDLRPVATLELFQQIGLFDEVGRLLEHPPARATARQLWAARSALLWEQGRYSTLRRMWTWRRRPDGTPRGERIERIGACLWVQGRLVPAYCWLTWHRRRSRGADRIALAETEGRVLEHMARTPELRWFARRAIRTLLPALGTPAQAAGVHPYRRLADLTSSLGAVLGGPRPAEHAATSGEWFGEAGSVLAWISYRHRHLRDTYPGARVDAGELRRQYRLLQRHYTSVGSRAGAVRTHLLPGAHRVFGFREVLHGVFAIQYGWWHRLRILLRHLVGKRRSRKPMAKRA